MAIFKSIFGTKEEHVPEEDTRFGEVSTEANDTNHDGDTEAALDAASSGDEEPKVNAEASDESANMTYSNSDPHSPSSTTFVPAKDFDSVTVWNESGVTSDEQRTVAKAQHLLGNLPEDTTDAVKRQIVEAALQAFEVSISDIIHGASQEIESLESYIRQADFNAEQFAANSSDRITALEAEISDIRETMRQSEAERERLVGDATEVINAVQPVRKFFSPNEPDSSPAMGVTSSLSEDYVSGEIA